MRIALALVLLLMTGAASPAAFDRIAARISSFSCLPVSFRPPTAKVSSLRPSGSVN